MPSLDLTRVVHVRQQDPKWCIPASTEMALRYVKPDIGLSQDVLFGMLKGRPSTFASYKEVLEAHFRSFRELQHLSVAVAAQEPREHDKRRKLIWDALERDCPVLLSLPFVFPGWGMVPLQQESGWELRWCPLGGCHIRLGGCHIRMCFACDDAGVRMLDPNLVEKEARVFISWANIRAAVAHPRGDGNVVGGGDILIVRSNTEG